MKVFVDAIALWAPTLPDWATARAAFRGEHAGVQPLARRPSPDILPPPERRRLPDSVALALTVADAAVRQSGRSARELPSVFTSCHGDLPITDAICTALVEHPERVSPTRFHNSVHNAASGYWGIATGCVQASTAVSAFESSFAAGLLEVATQVAADERTVLLVGYDVAACGALASTTASRGLLAVALVLAPQRSSRTRAALEWRLDPGPVERIALRSEAALPLAMNAMADALPLFEALARGDTGPLRMPLSAALALQVALGEFAHRG
ncbi:MAG: beta-ketoacyl synthase chain length factor [Burkholderiales bacterium]